MERRTKELRKVDTLRSNYTCDGCVNIIYSAQLDWLKCICKFIVYNLQSLFGNRGNDRLQRPSKNRPMEMNNNIRQPARGYPMKP